MVIASTVRRPRRRTAVAITALLALMVGLVAGCTSTGDAAPSSESDATGLSAAVADFVADWQAGRTHDAAQRTTDPAAAGMLLDTITADLKATAIHITTADPVDTADGDRKITATLSWSLPIVGTWRYRTDWIFTRSGGGGEPSWKLKYSPTMIHPDLGPQRTLVVRETPATAGTIVDRDDVQLISPVTVYSVVVLVAKVTDVKALAAAVAREVSRFDSTITAASIAAGIADARTAGRPSYTVINLREKDFARIEKALSTLGALSFPSQVQPLPPSRGFASVALSGALPIAEKMIVGRPGWRIVALDAAGDELDTLDSKAAVPGPKVTITLDQAVQNAAQQAVDAVDEPTVLVAIQPSTGEIEAVAQNAAADADGPISMTGQYPPGSIFKIVTASAAIDRHLITPQTSVACPGSIQVAGHSIHNEGFELGTVSATTAFAHSCNTTFATLATKMPGDALVTTARQYGIGLDYTIDGLVTLTGKISTADSIEARAQNGFGQGTDLVTPFSAALMAATVAAGKRPTPTLIRGTKTGVDAQVPSISASTAKKVKAMMRAVVTDGTARDLGDAGTVYAKTGTAEYVNAKGKIQAHAWTVGFRGDLAFAALIVGGNDSHRTNELLDGFLRAAR